MSAAVGPMPSRLRGGTAPHPGPGLGPGPGGGRKSPVAGVATPATCCILPPDWSFLPPRRERFQGASV
ncbi:MAG: hypothetical protein ACRCSP_06090, partial [Rhodoglobus sp.]